MNQVNESSQNEITQEETFEDSNVNKVLLRAVLTAEQVTEVEDKKKQPQAVMTQLHGNPTGFKTLDTEVNAATKAQLDEDGNLMMVAPVVGGSL